MIVRLSCGIISEAAGSKRLWGNILLGWHQVGQAAATTLVYRLWRQIQDSCMCTMAESAWKDWSKHSGMQAVRADTAILHAHDDRTKFGLIAQTGIHIRMIVSPVSARAATMLGADCSLSPPFPANDCFGIGLGTILSEV